MAAVNIAYDAANELTRWNSAITNLSYDNNGNLATETQSGVTTTYAWDARNRLTGISRAGLTAAFVYDGLGRRNSKTINGTTTGFWYDGTDLYAELTGAIPSATYIRGLSIDEPYIRKESSDEFYEADAVGTSVVLTNASGASQTTYTYEPFGNTTRTGTPSSNAFEYTGRENDGTGLYYYRSRFYSPRLQRFLAQDPVELQSGDTNLYSYVRNRPTAFTDPYEEAIPPLIAAGAIWGASINATVYLVGYYTSTDSFSWSDFGVTVANGAISGGLSGLAGPVAGTIAKAVGQSSSGAIAKVLTGLGSAAASGVGQYISNQISGRKDSIACAAVFGGAGGFAGSFISNKVANTLQQARYFSPSLGNLLTLGSPQSAAISISTVVGNIIGVGSELCQS